MSAQAIVLAFAVIGCLAVSASAAGLLTAADRKIPEASLIRPNELAKLLAGPVAARPTLFHVGFEVLYKGGHIPGSRFIGTASRPEGLEALRAAVRKLPQGKPLVLYCGCCPWGDCPNMKPAYAAVASTGRKVQILYIAQNMQKDWVDAGLPTTNPEH
jgi:hypothetical protein